MNLPKKASTPFSKESIEKVCKYIVIHSGIILLISIQKEWIIEFDRIGYLLLILEDSLCRHERKVIKRLNEFLSTILNTSK